MILFKQNRLYAAKPYAPRCYAIWPVLALLLLLSGCTVKLISSYDEKTDNAVTALQKDVTLFFITVQSQAGLPECNYSNHIGFYQQAKVDLSAIAVRSKAIAANEITVEQVELLQDSLTALEQLHQLGCFTPSQVDNLRTSFDSSITAILKLELAKKRGG
ncbi:hypothetical protein SAMN05660691_01931 [Rheinheimera pacifica]|uniref:Lipoprotein n=1 Tax=Rheinheimera pacifica TaxID=173990 RepID=A0A1H6LS29_9GAMM|nr:hypothetical protein SAMN05660691_01931 [Rheinheimera pacifica]